MLAALNPGALILGLAMGGLLASLVGFGLSTLLTIIGVEDGRDVGLVIGILSGLAGGGWVAGRRTKHSARFHGAVTGLLLAFVIVIIAKFGGSPAPTPAVLILAGFSILVGGLSGWLAGGRKPASRYNGSASPSDDRGSVNNGVEESPDSTGQGAG